jgi:DNA-binding NarL/FixJ family response regulator
VKVLVVDDQRVVADGLVHALSARPGFASVRSAHSVAETREVLTEFPAVVAIVDWALPDGDAVAALEAIHELRPACRVLVLADVDHAAAVLTALRGGCDGFVTRDRGIDELVRGVESVMKGEAVLSPAATAVLARDQRAPEEVEAPLLSPRELEIVSGLARGLTNRAIAEELFLSVHTVRNHVQRICRRLGASTRLEVVVIAAREGLVDLAAGA